MVRGGYNMPNRLGIDVSGAPGLIQPAMIFDIGIGTITKSPAIPVGEIGTVFIDLRTIRIQKPGLRELFKTLDNIIQGIVGQFIIMVQLHKDIALCQGYRPSSSPAR